MVGSVEQVEGLCEEEGIELSGIAFDGGEGEEVSTGTSDDECKGDMFEIVVDEKEGVTKLTTE